MTDLDQAIAVARESLANEGHRSADALRDLIAALDAARGQAVASVQTITSLAGETRKIIVGKAEVIDALPVGTAVYAALDAANAKLADTQRAIIEAAERRGYERGLKEAPPAAAVPAANVTPLRQPRLDLARLADAISAAVYDNAKGLSVTEAIGALELAKLELLKEQEQ